MLMKSLVVGFVLSARVEDLCFFLMTARKLHTPNDRAIVRVI